MQRNTGAARAQAGFSLVELMIVVAIVGILAAIAIPEYRHYIVRSQVSEAFVLARSEKAAFVEYWSHTGELPIGNDPIGMPSGHEISGQYVASVSIRDANHAITATFANTARPALRGKQLELIPQVSGASVEWRCQSAVAAQYLPDNCASTN